MSRRLRAAVAAGFTLLEVMIAMAILAGALTTLSVAVIRGLRTSQHARLMTRATFLCRQRMVELEDRFIVDGFTDDSGVKEEKGDFKEPAYKGFRWSETTERIRLPSAEQMQTAATKALQERQQIGADSNKPAAGAPAGGGGPLGGGGMGGLLGPVKDMLENGIRRITVRVTWDEPGLPNQQVEVVTFYTDMRRIPLTQ